MWAQLSSVEEKWKVVSDRKLVLCSQARNKGGPRDVTPICKMTPHDLQSSMATVSLKHFPFQPPGVVSALQGDTNVFVIKSPCPQ